MASTDTTPMVVKKCASPLPIPSAKIGVGIMDLSGLYEGTSFSLVEPVLSSLPNNYKPLFLTVSIKITGELRLQYPLVVTRHPFTFPLEWEQWRPCTLLLLLSGNKAPLSHGSAG